jgi:uncharacterized membrane protein YdjX (TVP38/TMEM64 family)
MRGLGALGFLGLLSVLLPPLGGLVLLGTINQVAPWLREHALLGLLIYVVAFIVLAGFALLPTIVQAVLAGWAFGMLLGWPAAVMGFAGASLVGYAVAKKCSGDRVEVMINSRPWLRSARQALIGQGGWRAVWFVALVRFPPQSPFAAGNVVLTSAGVGLWPYFLGTVIGMTPRTGVAVYIGSTLPTLDFSAPGQAWTAVASLVAGLVALVVIGVMARQAIIRAGNASQAEAGDGQAGFDKNAE